MRSLAPWTASWWLQLVTLREFIITIETYGRLDTELQSLGTKRASDMFQMGINLFF